MLIKYKCHILFQKHFQKKVVHYLECSVSINDILKCKTNEKNCKKLYLIEKVIHIKVLQGVSVRTHKKFRVIMGLSDHFSNCLRLILIPIEANFQS